MEFENNQKKIQLNVRNQAKIGYSFRNPFTIDDAARVVDAQASHRDRVIIIEKQQGKNSGKVRNMYFSSQFGKDPHQRLTVFKALTAPNVLKTFIRSTSQMKI